MHNEKCPACGVAMSHDASRVPPFFCPDCPPTKPQSRHTPGPWFLTDDNRIHPTTWEGKDNTKRQVALIASVSRWRGKPEHIPEANANARLIAAAPDLLLSGIMALQHIELIEQDTLGYESEAGKRLRAAIAKAEGT